MACAKSAEKVRGFRKGKKQALDQRKHQIDKWLQRERQSSQVKLKQDRTGDDRGRKHQCQGEEEMELDWPRALWIQRITVLLSSGERPKGEERRTAQVQHGDIWWWLSGTLLAGASRTRHAVQPQTGTNGRMMFYSPDTERIKLKVDLLSTTLNSWQHHTYYGNNKDLIKTIQTSWQQYRPHDNKNVILMTKTQISWQQHKSYDKNIVLMTTT